MVQFPCTRQEGIVGGTEVQLHSFLTSALDGVNGQFHGTAALPPGK
jgi:hypothetical protein